MTPKRAPAGLAHASDAQLADYVRQGDDAAFAVLVERHRRGLHRRCRRLLGSDAAAEDAVQQALLRALQALRDGAEVRRLEPWLHRIARNAALSELASHGSGHQALTEDLIDRRAGDVAEGRARLRAALLAVAALPSGQRSALLGAIRGDSHAETATRLGVSEVSARQLLSRARAAIRSAVGACTTGPLAWLSRQAGGVAQRLPVPSVTVAPLIPKLVAAVATVGAIAAPAGLVVLHSRSDSPPATATLAGAGDPRSDAALPDAAGSAVALLGATRRGAGAGTVLWRESGHGAPGAVGAASGSGAAGGRRRGAPAATTGGAGAAPQGTASTTATSADAVPADQSWSDPGTADPSATDPTATTTDPSTTDPTATTTTDPTATTTDPSATDPTATTTDPSATDPTATAGQSSTDTTATDPTVSAP